MSLQGPAASYIFDPTTSNFFVTARGHARMVVTTAYRIERPCTVLGKHPRERSPACLQEWLCVCILGDSHSRNECCTLVGLEHVLPKRMRPLKLDEAMCRHIMQIDSDVGYSRNQDLLVRCGFEPAEPTSVAATEPTPVATTPTEPTNPGRGRASSGRGRVDPSRGDRGCRAVGCASAESNANPRRCMRAARGGAG